MAVTENDLRMRRLDGLSDRKRRLYVCALARTRTDVLGAPEMRCVEAAEQYVDGLISEKNLADCRAAIQSSTSIYPYTQWAWLATDSPNDLRNFIVDYLDFANHPWQINVLTDIAGPPYIFWWTSMSDIGCDIPGYVILQDCWRTPLLQTIAKEAYDDRLGDDGTLDVYHLHALADAIDDTFAPQQSHPMHLLLEHLRLPGQNHYRGCWALDLLLLKQ